MRTARILLVGATLVFVVASWVAWIFLKQIFAYYGYSFERAELGVWGDSFGALTSFFTAIGFVAVGATFWLQRRQTISSELFQQNERFDNLYFEVLKLIREVRKDVRFVYSDRFATDSSRKKEFAYDNQAFRFAWREVAYYFEQSDEKLTLQETINLYHETVHDRFESGFAPYFRSTYTILKLIDEQSSLSEKEKSFYANLVRGQLSSYELAVIGLNALSPVSGNFKHLLTKYRMLKYLPKDTTRRKVLLPHYDSVAFEARND